MSELDQALERLHLCGFEYSDAHPNSGPVAVESLDCLGHASLISGLMDVYVPRLPTLVEGRPLREGERVAARGRIDRAGDWLADYERALLGSSWSEVVAEAFAPEGDDLGASHVGLHGLIRLGHAVRSVMREDSSVRRREVAFALAYCAARCLPWKGRGDASEADHWVERSRRLSTETRDQFLGLTDELLAAFCLSGAETYLADRENRAHRSLAVVAPSALRFLLPRLPPPESKQVLESVFARLEGSLFVPAAARIADEAEDLEVARCSESPSEIRYRAACSVHEHAIVMAEACLREEKLHPHATLLRAAADAALRLSPPGYQEWR